MRWQGMVEFVAAAQAASFTQAAKQLGTSVAHISRSVSALEEYYNTQLFIRSTRKVVLTQQGELLLHHAKKAQAVLEQGEWALKEQQAQPSGQLKITAKSEHTHLQLVFFEQLFELLDLIERLDLRSDLTKDLEAHEKNLVYWSKHPKIDSTALDQALKTVLRLKEKLKTDRRFGSALKDDKLLSAIRQRFAIPGGACSFDLPNLHFWLQQPLEQRQEEIT